MNPIRKTIILEFIFIELQAIYFIAIESYEFHHDKNFYFSPNTSTTTNTNFVITILMILGIYLMIVVNYVVI
jgi:hypothetical protein